MEPIETIVIAVGDKQATIKIFHDTDPESPREWSNLCSMALPHRRYTLCNDERITIEQAKEIENDPDYIWLPVYGYDHGGLTINTSGYSCPWDSGRLGIIYVSKAKVREEMGWKVITLKRKNQLLRRMIDEVKTYDQYLTGDVYGYTVECEGEEDSCWGFYGMDTVKQEATDVANHMLAAKHLTA